MRIALVVACLVIVACGEDSDPPSKYAIEAVHAVDQRTFDAGGVDYTLVRVAYGSDSVYCAFRVEGEEYPVYADFAVDEDVLFDEDEGLTGLDLPIFDDEDFDAWLWDTDPEEDVLVTCFD